MEAKRPNHELSPMRCPVHLDDVDLFSPGAQEYWYEAYDILHAEAPVHRIPGEGFEPGTDAFILSKHEDIAMVVRDQQRFPVVTSLALKHVIEAGGDPFELPNVNTLVASMVSLRPNPEMWRTHRQELTVGSARVQAAIGIWWNGSQTISWTSGLTGARWSSFPNSPSRCRIP